MIHNFQDLTGRRFGRLLVISRAPRHLNRTMWNCLCDCGTERVVWAASFKKNTRSCGCLRSEITGRRSRIINRKHGMWETSEWGAWTSMKERCTNKNHPSYCHYGGRGITVCPQWLKSFENFYADMGPKPAGLTLDRINNDSGYYKENCRWATRKEQSRNQRRNVYVEAFGRRLIVTDWAGVLKISPTSLREALKAGETLEHIVARRGCNAG